MRLKRKIGKKVIFWTGILLQGDVLFFFVTTAMRNISFFFEVELRINVFV